MMRGMVVPITAIFARIFLKEAKYAHHIFALVILVSGVLLVGVVNIVWAPPIEGESGTTIFGVLILLIA